jgi:hypothetical protein
MHKRILFAGIAALGTLAVTASAQAAYLTLGTGNTSNATTTLSGNPAGAELLVKNTNGSSANAFGLYGLLTATSPTATAAAVRGTNNSTNGYGFGVYGSQAGSGTGIRGFAPNGKGVFGSSTSGTGVYGLHSSTSGTAAGVSASTNSTATNASALVATVSPGAAAIGTAAVRAFNNGFGYAVWGSSVGHAVFGQSQINDGVIGGSDSSTGVYGFSNTGYGVLGQSTSSDAGYFQGHVTITNGCTGCAGAALKIDHPLDPAHKYLQHSAVVSSQMKDMYDGVTTTNRKGFATVQLPRWFQTLNKRFRYQLTVVGKAHWDAKAAVWEEIAHSRFTIRTDQPQVKVSWQVTGIRHDRYANAHRIQVVVPKAKDEQGKYLHPELYGKPKSEGIGYQKPPKPPTLPRKPDLKR